MKSSRIPVILIALAAFSFVAGGCDILVTERGGNGEPCEDSDCDQGLVCINDVCVDNNGCSDLCDSPGDLRCQPGGPVVEKCAPVGECLNWVQDIDCGANGQICNPAPNPHCEGCESNCSQAGDLRCRFGAEAVEECTDMGNDCLVWTDKESCDDIGQICIENPSPHCQDGCQSNCPSDGAIRCHPTDPAVEVCAPDGDCINWQLQEDCGQNGNICIDDGTPHCELDCNDLCIEGNNRCTADQLAIEVCAADQDGCMVWQFQEGCSGDEHCHDDTVNVVCEVNCPSGTDGCPAPGEERCSSDNTFVETCIYDVNWCRFWSLLENCVDQGLVCVIGAGDNASCESDLCLNGDECPTLGQTQCSDDNLFIDECQEDPADTCQRWAPLQECETVAPSFICSNDVCTDPCPGGHDCDNVGDLRCGGTDWVEKCVMEADQCRRWQLDIDCPSLDSQCVDSGTPQCECISHGCSLGDYKCSDDYVTLLECKPDPVCRQWTIRENCVSTNQICIEIAGQNPVCEACKNDCTTLGALHCAGTVIETCKNPDGSCTMFRPTSDCGDNGEVCEQVDTQVTCLTIAAHCTNGYQDFDESDADCGGTECQRCGGNRACTINLDCLSDDCATDVCQLPTFCNDGTYQPELGEQGFDCGGPCLGCEGDPCSAGDQCDYVYWCNPNENRCKVWLDAWNMGFSDRDAIKSIDLSGKQFGAFPDTYLLAFSDANTPNIGVVTFDATEIPLAIELPNGHSATVESLAFGPPGADGYDQDLYTTGGDSLALWPYLNADGSYGGHTTIANGSERLAVETNGRYIASSSGDGDISIRDHQGAILISANVGAPVNDMAFSIYRGAEPSFLVIASEAVPGSSEYGLHMIHLDRNPDPYTTATTSAAFETVCRKITIHSNNQYVAATCGPIGSEWIEIVDLNGNPVTVSSASGYSTVAFQPDPTWGHFLFAGTHDSRLVVFDLSAGFPSPITKKCSQQLSNASYPIYDLAFTPNNAWLALSSWNEIIMIDTAQWMTMLSYDNCWMPSP